MMPRKTAHTDHMKNEQDEKTAWERFVKTGAVRDYLNYARHKKEWPPKV